MRNQTTSLALLHAAVLLEAGHDSCSEERAPGQLCDTRIVVVCLHCMPHVPRNFQKQGYENGLHVSCNIEAMRFPVGNGSTDSTATKSISRSEESESRETFGQPSAHLVLHSFIQSFSHSLICLVTLSITNSIQSLQIPQI